MEFDPYSLTSGALAMASIEDLDGDLVDDLVLGLQDATVRVLSGRTGTEIFRLNSPVSNSSYGSAVAAIGDADGDLVADFAVGAKFEQPGGVVRIYSGATGLLRHEITSPTGWSGFGWNLLGPGDLDGDGRGDLIIAMPGTSWGSGGPPGAFSAVSGATGTSLYSFTYPRSTRFFAEGMAALGDADGDGVPEYAIGTPDAAVGGSILNGEVLIFSGASGAPIQAWQGGVLAALGKRLALAGDIDGDLVPELYADGAIYSIRTGAQLLALASDPPSASLSGRAVGGVDVTGDGQPDLVVGSPLLNRLGALNSGGCFVFDPRDGRILQRIYGQADDYLGEYVAVVSGLGGDAAPDVALGGYLRAKLRSHGFSSLLHLDPTTLSATVGGIVHIELSFPRDEAQRRYLLLASASGTGPTQFGGIQVPLGYDPIYRRMLVSPPAWLQGARGSLDAQARASALLHAAPGATSAWIGRSLWFAAATYEGVLARHSSRAQALTIVP